jgi:hypothetical protein
VLVTVVKGLGVAIDTAGAYGNAQMQSKRTANTKVVEMVLPPVRQMALKQA